MHHGPPCSSLCNPTGLCTSTETLDIWFNVPPGGSDSAALPRYSTALSSSLWSGVRSQGEIVTRTQPTMRPNLLLSFNGFPASTSCPSTAHFGVVSLQSTMLPRSVTVHGITRSLYQWAPSSDIRRTFNNLACPVSAALIPSTVTAVGNAGGDCGIGWARPGEIILKGQELLIQGNFH